ncbi:UDP-N-acetylmuramoyl-tripeptide--D-alanyl-D-alanine ligase [Candidatus Nomurabacteria bacterium]|jgi:UDP-N-acetylmuramoyl-tripeptide--D-alanyl-D-alanine ligase|nr:MAG: UDP-N-acetylmuramoyl-tripeptide--D-alanyl-D-alanine ligase [Candidatus Nomurabacteria bacterium]
MTDVEHIYKLYKVCPKVFTDSRKVEVGGIFFALSGEQFDGNAFAEKALELGARSAVIDNEIYKKDERYIVVPNVLQSLQELARKHREQFTIPIIGITGSNGKTTTKELCREVLSQKGYVLATEGNLNNHIGVPLTILTLTHEHQYAIIEMGDNKRGDIKELCQIAKPTIGIITNVGKDHLGGYKNQKENVATKLELFDYLKEQNGVVLVNSEDADLMNAAEHIEKSIYTPSNYEVKLENAYLTYKQKDAWIPTKLYGLFNIANIACAKALGDHFATNNKEMDKAISNYEPLLMRSQIVETKTNTIILDAYNANPSSMVLALDSFNILESKNKKVAILGDMLELGIESEEEHRKIVDLVEQYGIEAYLYGPEFYKSKNDKALFFPNFETLFDHITNMKFSNTTILLKASRGMKVERLVPVL